MCIGLPMTVVDTDPGHATCQWRGEHRRVDTALVGDCVPGDRLLVFIDSARERLDAARAAEIEATLELLALAFAGDAIGAAGAEAGFVLPSATSPEQLASWTGVAAATSA
jgi:hydrogenase expression/formation protein HypC